MSVLAERIASRAGSGSAARAVATARAAINGRRARQRTAVRVIRLPRRKDVERLHTIKAIIALWWQPPPSSVGPWGTFATCPNSGHVANVPHGSRVAPPVGSYILL